MKRQRCTRRLGARLTFCCACILLATSSNAEWEAVPDITLAAETNDNPALDIDGEAASRTQRLVVDSASRMLADIRLRLRRAEQRGEISFEPRVRGDAYADENAKGLASTDVFLRSNGVHRGQTAQVGYTADVSRERILGVEFLETLPTDPVGDDPSAIATTQIGDNERRTLLGFSPYVDVALSSRGTVRFDGRILDVDYGSGTGAELTDSRNPTTGSLQRASDFVDRTIGGEYRRTLRQQGTIGVRVFVTSYEAALNDNTTDTHGVELVYARALSEVWSWNISGGAQRSDFALSAAGGRVTGTDDTHVFGIGLAKRGEVSEMRAELGRRMSPDTLGFVAPRDELRIAWQRMLSARVNGRFALRAIDAEGVSTVRDSDRRYGRLELDLEWRFAEQWWFGAGYAHATARSGLAVEGAESNTVTLGIRYRGRSNQAGALAL